MAGFGTLGVKLEYAVGTGSTTPTSYTLIPDVVTIPSLIGTPGTTAITTIYDTTETYIDNKPDTGGTIAITVNFTEELLDVCDTILAAQKAGSTVHYKVSLPTPLDREYTWVGKLATPSNADIGSSGAITGTLNITPTGEIDFKKKA